MLLPDAASRCCFLVQLPAGSSLSSASSRCCSLAHLPAGSVFPMALRTGTSDRSCSPVLVCIFPMALCHGGASHKALRNGAPASIFPMAIRHSAASLFATAPGQHFPDDASPRRPDQQQTSSGGEKYSGLASNLAHLGRIC